MHRFPRSITSISSHILPTGLSKYFYVSAINDKITDSDFEADEMSAHHNFAFDKVRLLDLEGK
ncbi:MAG TPA: hypothetical protein PKM72_12805 [Nitrospirales bacterium]|nr:hypothetical protein [Nitrospirales bacterium]